MKNFTISPEVWAQGFQAYSSLNPDLPIEPQLRRQRIQQIAYSSIEYEHNNNNLNGIKRVIEWNSSLRVSLGWRMSSASLTDVIFECTETAESSPRFNIIEIVSDLRCDWIGFLGFNTFDKLNFETLSKTELIDFNNEIIDYQVDVLTNLSKHPVYRSYRIVRDLEYRYNYFKAIRKNPIALGHAFQYYIDALMVTSELNTIAADVIEEMIGHHYLYYPEVFFESLNFNILRGSIYERQ